MRIRRSIAKRLYRWALGLDGDRRAFEKEVRAKHPELLETVAVPAEPVPNGPQLPVTPPNPPVRPPFQKLDLAAYGLQHLLDEYEFETVLDVGSGHGAHSRVMKAHGKQITKVDFLRSPNKEEDDEVEDVICGDFVEMDLGRTFDCVWASHILEHQVDAQRFLRKLFAAANDGGLLVITVPPLKQEVVSGHVSLWNQGLLLYNLVVAGQDCREAEVIAYGYNLTVIVRKRLVELPELAYGLGDIDRLLPFLPPGFHEAIDGSTIGVWTPNA